jgi:hypothetical protein
VHKDLKFRAFKAAFDKARLSTDPLDRIVPCLAQMRKAEAAHMTPLDAFELRPQPFTGMQFRRVGREALNMEPLPRPIRADLCDHAAAMHRCSSPDEHQVARDFPQQMLQKGHDIGRVERPCLTVNIPPPRWGDGTDGREVSTRPPRSQEGRVPHWGIGADAARQGRNPGLVDEEDGLLRRLRPCLRAGQVS